MKDGSPWARFKHGIGQDLQRVGHRLGPVRARVQDSWQSLSLLDKLFFVVVVVGFLIILIILTRYAFPWDALSITALSRAPRHIGAIGIGFVLIVLLFLLWRLPKRKATRLTSGLKEQFDIENETRKTWATIVGGMAVLSSLLFTWGNLRVTQDNLRITQETATKSQEVTREGQITDGFTKAITQLGDAERLAVRLGGIYALERIAKESEKHHWPIMEVLTAYVRENAPWKEERDSSQDKILSCKRFLEMSQPTFPKLPTDIQAILTVLGRRTLAYEVGWSPPRFTAPGAGYQNLDLRGTNLRNADLVGAHLEGAIFIGARLEGACLVGVRLEGADLTWAHLEGVDLSGAQLQGADLRGTHLERACLGSANLRKADLEGTPLERAELLWARLEGAHLSSVNLKGADLRGAHLQGAEIWTTHLEGAHLKGANIQGALIEMSHLEGADLSEAHLEGASLGSISLEGADLKGTYLEKAFLGGTNLQGAKNLTIKQLSTVRTLYEAQLDQPLLEQVQQQYPQLLEEEKIQSLPPWKKSKE